jgi:RecJ-like exonuclease
MLINRNKGDEEFVKLLSELKKELEAYTTLFSSINSSIGKSLVRFDALLYPSAENKLKAVSLPSMETIGEEIKESITNASSKRKNILNLLDEVDDIIQTSKIKCSHCEGKGKISKTQYYRDDDITQTYVNLETCPVCEGKGYLLVSDTVVKLASELMIGLRELKVKKQSSTK